MSHTTTDGIHLRRHFFMHWTATDRWSYPSFPGGPMIQGHGITPRRAIRDLHRRRTHLRRIAETWNQR